ncbi:hypothetical protein D9M71_122570 [compost metagenome]
MLAQVADQWVALAYRQAMGGLPVQLHRLCCTLAGQQDIGVFQVRSGYGQLGITLGTGRDGGDQVGLALSDSLDHVEGRVAVQNLEAQSCAQADQLKQVSTDATVVARLIKERQGGEVFRDHHANHRVAGDPLFFSVRQLQPMIGQQDVAAGAPAFEDAFAGSGGNGSKGGIDHLQQ